MSVKWTDRQQKVIDLHNRNLLVAAAAGSGKTAVLVERMIQLITRKNDPIDIDRLLVVTFTNAAAAEMRERIGGALEAALKEDPSNVHLQTQITLLHNAQISTIHSFGLSVIRNHFYQIGLDPAFRIGDDREISMLKEDVLEDVLEEAYALGETDFLDFVKTYGNTKNDKNICEMILNFYSYADSYPWPKEWLLDCLKMYETDTLEAFQRLPWVNELVRYVQSLAEGFKSQMCSALAIANETDGPFHYKETLELDLALIEQLCACDDYQTLYQMFSDMEWADLSKKRPKVDPDKKARCKDIRDSVKKQLRTIKDTYFSYSPTEQLSMLMEERASMGVLVRLTTAFMDRFAQAKADKNIVDFGDIEHLTLKILVDEKTKCPTAAAKEYQHKFYEIMIDEYQDSNYVQEAMLKAVSKEQAGNNNMFMVGDVKQSIYRFRLARPELFMEKYRTYTVHDSKNQRIDLHHNFRSRPEVLDFTNQVFFHVMDQDIGNVIYDDEAALYPGGEFSETQEAFLTELMLIEAEKGADKIEHEARIVAAKIRQMTDPVLAGDNCFEPKDIVILVHAMKGWSDIFLRVFAQEGVPLISSSKSGYFAAVEVQTVIQLLKVLNNPRQDIPMAGVLKSVIGGFSDTEMALIKAAFPEKAFYESVLCWKNLSGEDAASIVAGKLLDSEQLIVIYEKVQRFFAFLDEMRMQIPDTPIHELIQTMYEKTGYLDYVTALPGGERRRANLDMLVELAISYESTSYQGLFDFVRYIEKMIRFELDYGEAELVSDQENAVRMMTIHKSKGLEFPVVFVCGMGKEFNLKSLNSPLIFHPKHGAGLRWMGKDCRVKKNTLARQVFGLLEKRELLGEEQRLLYVALTRAKQKLVLTGIAKEREKYDGELLEAKQVLSFSQRMDAKCFWDWVLPAVYRGGIRCKLEEVNSEYAAAGNVSVLVSRIEQREALMEQIESCNLEYDKQMDEMLNWTYPHAESTILKQKVSVSELKHRYMESQDLEDAVFLHKEQEVIPYIPRFAERVEEENAGALRGTAMHRYLECFRFKNRKDVEDEQLSVLIEQQLETMFQSGRLSEDLRQRLNLSQIKGFLLTDEAKRMAAADGEGNLYREKPFVMSVPASDVWEGASPEESVLVQGIVDVFWMEEDGITLLDYKTDAVSEPGELVRRYKLQLKLYADALSRVFDNCPVKDILIYSFRLETMVSLMDTESFSK